MSSGRCSIQVSSSSTTEIMEQEQINEFGHVQEAAIERLRTATGWRSARKGSLKFQLLTLPSFENGVSWEVREVHLRHRDSQTRLYRYCWRMDVDLDAFSSPVKRLKHPRPYSPTIEVAYVEVDQTIVARYQQRISSTPVSLVAPKNSIGLDGVIYELALGDFCQSRLCWWCKLPEEWQPLQPIIDDMFREFEFCWRAGPQHESEDGES